MSRRTSILKAITEKLKIINGTGIYSINLFNNVFPTLKFWDEVSDYPSVYATTGPEYREYLPSNFTWGYLTITLRIYTQGEQAQDDLEKVIDDIETVINNNRNLVYDSSSGASTTEILITYITTDEGLLAPYGVGEMTLEVRYPTM